MQRLYVYADFDWLDGTSLGGARPKASAVNEEGRLTVAKIAEFVNKTAET